MNIFKFEFKRLLKSCIIWSLVCGALITLFMSLFPTMEDMGMQQIVNNKMGGMPVEILKAFNINSSMDFTDIFNYLGYAIQYIAMASAVYDEEHHRLPATYANFLIMNEAVLYPTYADSVNDMRAKEVLAEAFPGREIVGIDCTALIKQHGSLHCVTMQYPEGVY